MQLHCIGIFRVKFVGNADPHVLLALARVKNKTNSLTERDVSCSVKFFSLDSLFALFSADRVAH